ncbi:hypothetical protein JCM5296_005474 [Sporobolomyces johnsonii]
MSAKKPRQDQSTEQSSLLPAPAPPPYSELAQHPPHQPSTSSSSTPSAPAPSPATFLPSSPSPSRPRHPAGPTAFHALPPPTTSTYAHSRALAQADRRARRRICAALCWGFVIYLAAGMLVGGIVGEEWSRALGRERKKWEREHAGGGEGAGAATARTERRDGPGQGEGQQSPEMEREPTVLAAPVSVGGELFATI